MNFRRSRRGFFRIGESFPLEAAVTHSHGPEGAPEHGAWAFTSYETTWIPFAVLGGITVGIVIVMLMALKRRDPV